MNLWGFAPTCREPQGRAIGMMEQWNCGMMGLKKTKFKAPLLALFFLL